MNFSNYIEGGVGQWCGYKEQIVDFCNNIYYSNNNFGDVFVWISLGVIIVSLFTTKRAEVLTRIAMFRLLLFTLLLQLGYLSWAYFVR